MPKSNRKKYFLSLGIIIVLSFFIVPVFYMSFFQAEASSANNATGWLWGGSEDASIGGTPGSVDGNETGVGWISVNDVKEDGTIINPGSTIPYGLNIPPTDGLLSGYVWSENLGWISFQPEDVVDCPQAPCDARRSGDDILGWAMVLGIKTEYEKTPSNSGGWQGFIKLNGITIYNDTLQGYGWNGETIGTENNYANGLGWIDFTGVKIGVAKTLKICEMYGNGGCMGGFLRNNENRAMVVGGTNNLKACYNSSSGCDDISGDVTAIAVWRESGYPQNAVSLSGTDPKIIKADSVGEEIVSVSHDGQTAEYTLAVSDVSIVDCWTCQSRNCSFSRVRGSCEEFTSLSSCEAACKPYPGWKEVAP